MNLFNKLPGFKASPPGLERVVLRHLPGAWLWGTLAVVLPLLVWRLFGVASSSEPLTMPEIYAISVLLFYWTVLLMVAIAAFIVMVMKGPAYVADAYPLPEVVSTEGSDAHHSKRA